MDEKKESPKIFESIKSNSKLELQKKHASHLKAPKAKFSMKKVGRSRNQKGQKSY